MIAPPAAKPRQVEILRKLGRGGHGRRPISRRIPSQSYRRPQAHRAQRRCRFARRHRSRAPRRRIAEAPRGRGIARRWRLRIWRRGKLLLRRHGIHRRPGSRRVDCATARWRTNSPPTRHRVAETLENAHNFQTTIGGKNFHGIVHRRHQAQEYSHRRARRSARSRFRQSPKPLALAPSHAHEFGSVPYASPERLDTGDVNRAVRLWSLAVMLYEMLTGLQPYYAESTEPWSA